MTIYLKETSRRRIAKPVDWSKATLMLQPCTIQAPVLLMSNRLAHSTMATWSILVILALNIILSQTLSDLQVEGVNDVYPIQSYDERQLIVPKRSTMLLNKLMHALHKALRSETVNGQQMELQRRGEGKMFWRCYFNAVSCFRRK